jgi:hypothetical protein
MHVDPCRNTMTVSERRFLEGVGFGLIGTLAMSVVMLIVYVTGQSLMEEPAPLSFAVRLVAAVFRMPSITAGAVVGGVVLHLAYGALWFGLVALSTRRITWRKGLAVGLGLWILMAVFIVPFAGMSVFSVATSWRLWVFTLIGHAVYGAVGGLAGELYAERHVPRGAYP